MTSEGKAEKLQPKVKKIASLQIVEYTRVFFSSLIIKEFRIQVGNTILYPFVGSGTISLACKTKSTNNIVLIFYKYQKLLLALKKQSINIVHLS
jgi:hypothetical protein